MTKLLLIGQVSNLLRKSQATIRRWEKSGLIKPTIVLDDGTRLFSEKYIARIKKKMYTDSSEAKDSR